MEDRLLEGSVIVAAVVFFVISTVDAGLGWPVGMSGNRRL